jgi:hypothetical protein
MKQNKGYYKEQVQAASDKELTGELYAILRGLDETMLDDPTERERMKAHLKEKWNIVSDELEKRARERAGNE